ncbi:hypothetical protein [Cellulomonas sp. ATA003]|nr:hypothetical protein [Cellulomonas sp. ATA003]WNB85139.1 hypothetical protein REH70_16040 [Cellulomonas sp. ATA003]
MSTSSGSDRIAEQRCSSSRSRLLRSAAAVDHWAAASPASPPFGG